MAEIFKRDHLSKKNSSGLNDPTAYKAIKNVDRKKYDAVRFYKLMDMIYNICELAGFTIEERIVVKDQRTGKVWRYDEKKRKGELNYGKEFRSKRRAAGSYGDYDDSGYDHC